MRSSGLSASASESWPGSRGQGSTLRTLLLTVFALTVLRAARLGEDAYTTFRTVDNLVGGHGLRWNVAERVQAFTHPLWMLLVSAVYSITREIYYSVILLSLAVSVAAMYVLAFRLAKDLAAAVLVLAALTLSRAFVDYSTSGLENPLTHLLLAVFFLVALRDAGGGGPPPGSWRLATVSLWGALAMLNRLDIGLIVGPPLLLLIARDLLAPGDRRRPFRSLGMVALGFSPLVAWQLFSLFYYGFPFPNTAYGKLFVATGMGLTPRSLGAELAARARLGKPAVAGGVRAGLARDVVQVVLSRKHAKQTMADRLGASSGRSPRADSQLGHDPVPGMTSKVRQGRPACRRQGLG